MNTIKIEKSENKQNIAQRLICTFSRSNIDQFIKRNTEVFQGLSRHSTPFGGTIRPVKRTSSTYQSNKACPVQNTTMTTFEQHLVSLQQQLEYLHTEVSSLLAQTSITTQSTKPLLRPKSTTSSLTNQKSPIGIQRYRQLQATE